MVDADEVLLMDPSIHSLLLRVGSVSKIKMKEDEQGWELQCDCTIGR